MATQVRLSYAWASDGGKIDPGNTEYKLGWIAEIPTFEEFNYVLNVIDNNIKVLAEQSEFEWDALVTYKAGAEVWYDNTKYIARDTNTNVDPLADTLQNHWVQTPVYGKSADLAIAKEGLYLHGVANKTSNYWGASDITIYNNSSLISMMVTGFGNNYLLGNVRGDMVIIDVGQTASPDNRAITIGQPGVYKIFHEGNPPTIADVGEGLGENPVDGNQYLRYNNTWSKLNRANASTISAGGGGADFDAYFYNYITPESLENSGVYATVSYVNSIGAAFPAGTRMMFAQSHAPTGWTMYTGYDGRIMRIQSSSGGTTGGSNNPINWNHRHFGGTEWVNVIVDDASGQSGHTAGPGTWGHKHEIAWDPFQPKYVDVVVCTKD